MVLISDKVIAGLQPEIHFHCIDDNDGGTVPFMYKLLEEQFWPHGPVPFSHVNR